MFIEIIYVDYDPETNKSTYQLIDTAFKTKILLDYDISKDIAKMALIKIGKIIDEYKKRNINPVPNIAKYVRLRNDYKIYKDLFEATYPEYQNEMKEIMEKKK
jgi:hypothetical protein